MHCKHLSALLLFALALGLTGLFGCSDDDPTTPPGTVDETAPLVLEITPEAGQMEVALDAAVAFRFSEAMDPASLTGAITLSSGTLVDAVWSEGNTVLTVTHSAWSEGDAVTATAGTTLTDAAGNALIGSFATTFYTWSSVPVLVDLDLSGDPAALPLNGHVIFRFSEPIAILSIVPALTFDESIPGKTVPPYTVSHWDNDGYTVAIYFMSDLTPLTTYTITIGTAALTEDGDNLSAPAVAVFTTAAEADETPPTILSTVPAVGEVVGTDLAAITVTFSEPVDQATLQPAEMAAMLQMFMLREPTWNAGGDELTLYLDGPLPAGIRFYAILEPGNFRDLSFNPNTETDSLSFTTAGDAVLWPIREDLRLYYIYSHEEDVYSYARQTIENVDGTNFQRVLKGLDETGFNGDLERWLMSRSGQSIRLEGFSDDQTATFDPAVDYLPAPLPAGWSGTSTLTIGQETATLTYSGQVLRTERQEVSFRSKAMAPAVTYMYLDDVVVVELTHAMTAPGADLPFEIGTDVVHVCPGLGIVGMESLVQEFDGDVEVGTRETYLWFYGAGLNDRLEGDFLR